MARIELWTTPPGTVGANEVIGTIVDAVTAREGGKSRAVGSACVG